MRNLCAKLWSDDDGALIATEFLFVVTILVLGIIVGLTSVRNAVNSELAELANAILALSQGYSISGLTGCCSEVQGSSTIDIPGLVDPILCIDNSIPSFIEELPCD